MECRGSQNECEDKNLIITFAGGSRGLGKAILDTYKKKGFNRIAFHRRKNILGVENHEIDIDCEATITNAMEELLLIYKERKVNLMSIHFLSGGGLGKKKDDIELKVYKRIMLHNYLIPAYISDFLIKNTSNKRGVKPKMEFNYYSSSVALNNRADPHYVSAKSALEGYFKSKFIESGNKVKMRMYRLGMVDIKHKYFHKLKGEKPEEFNKILEANVPSGYFKSPEDIAKIVCNMSIDSSDINGVIYDLSGGNSWI